MNYQVVFQIPVIVENCDSKADAIKNASAIVLNTYSEFIPSVCCATIEDLSSRDVFFYHAGLATYELLSKKE